MYVHILFSKIQLNFYQKWSGKSKVERSKWVWRNILFLINRTLWLDDWAVTNGVFTDRVGVRHEKSAEGLYWGAANGNESFFVNLFRVKREGVEYKINRLYFVVFLALSATKIFSLNQAICARTGSTFLPHPVLILLKKKSIRTILKRTLFRVKWYWQMVLGEMVWFLVWWNGRMSFSLQFHTNRQTVHFIKFLSWKL